jgi:predicted PurR-regulated permease PerM
MLTPGEQARTTLQRAYVLFFFILISIIFLRLVWGFLVAVVMAAIFAGLAHPLYSRLLRFFRGRRAAAAAATLVLVILLVVVPLAFFVEVVAVEAVQISQSVRPQVSEFIDKFDEPGASLDWIPFWDRLEPFREQIIKKAGEVASAISTFLVNQLSAAAQGTLRFLLKLFIMLYSMFFFLMHGREALDQVMRMLPLEESDKKLLVGKFVSVSRATIKGTLVIAIVQGGLAGLAFAVVGIKGAVFWGTVMAVLSIIPAIGATLVWVPAVIYLATVGRTLPAIGLLLWCAIIVGTADNVLRPLLVGKDTEMPDLLILLSTFGGLALFGAVGLVIGPVIAALFLAMRRIYCDTFGELLMTPGPERTEVP